MRAWLGEKGKVCLLLCECRRGGKERAEGARRKEGPQLSCLSPPLTYPLPTLNVYSTFLCGPQKEVLSAREGPCFQL